MGLRRREYWMYPGDSEAVKRYIKQLTLAREEAGLAKEGQGLV